jgi:hypothetical protein
MSNEAIEEEWQRGNGRTRRGASEMTGEPLAPWDLADWPVPGKTAVPKKPRLAVVS